jgi:hypothetical protein
MNELHCTWWHNLTEAQQQRVVQHVGVLDQWLQMPRYRPSSIAVGWINDAPCVVTVVAHERIAVEHAQVDVGVLRWHALCGAGTHHHLLEVLMQQALTMLDEGIAVLMVAGDAAQWSAYGFAPVSYITTTTWPDTMQQLSLPAHAYRIAVPTAAEYHDIRSMQVAQSASGMPQLIDVVSASDHMWVLSIGHDGQMQAAARYVATDAGTEVVAATASHAGAAHDLINVLLHAPDIARPVTMRLPFNHAVTQAALQNNAQTVVRAAAQHTTLVGVLDLPAMLTALIPAFQQRVRVSAYADWVGGARIEISDERAMIMLDHSEITVIDGSRDAAIRMRNVELPALAQLLLGYRSVAALRRQGLLYCDDTELAVWQVLFPERQPVIDLS